ncbi:hypothetical protein BJ165DRAFT_1530968 [Panaeolus papilionaceus]|nr:hypothetical protein BJ165DRAFT_1530968 [Panaeolus papilionaceus]
MTKKVSKKPSKSSGKAVVKAHVQTSSNTNAGKGKKKAAQESSMESSDEEPEEIKGEKGGTMTVVWTNDLTETLINHIIQNTDIWNGLWSSTGTNASTAQGGGEKKKHWHWELAKALFTHHPVYSQEFASVLKSEKVKSSTERQEWTAKIGNRLKKMVKIVTDYNKEMGKTGEGLKSAQEIREGTELSNKWEAIREKCPWYFRMKEIIGGRPTAEPAGLGNASTTPDLSILSTTSAATVSSISLPDNYPLTDDIPTGTSEIDFSDGMATNAVSDPDASAMLNQVNQVL